MRALRVEMSPMRVGASLENNKFLRSYLLPIDHFSQSQHARVLWSLLRKLDSKSSFEGITRVNASYLPYQYAADNTIILDYININKTIKRYCTPC